MTVPYQMPEKRKLTDAELIEHLRSECKRVKIQRNQYEEKLTVANRKINTLEVELKMYKNYINQRKP